jgi:hypothetical protein
MYRRSFSPARLHREAAVITLLCNPLQNKERRGG